MYKDKTKILYLVTQSELGGAQRYIFDLVKNLQNEFIIEIAFGAQGEKGEMAQRYKTAGFTCYAIPHLKRAISPIDDFLALIEIIKLIKKIKPDIIHLNSSKASILGSLATKICRSLAFNSHKIHIIYTVHGWVFNEPLPTWKKLFYKYAEKFTALFKDKLICVSEFDRQTALQKRIAPTKKLTTIHNGIAPINFLPQEQARQNLFSQLSNVKCQTSNVIIGSIGNLYKTKGFEYLIDAVKLLVNKGMNITTIIIGEGEERNHLKDWITQNRLEKNVILAGRINHAAELLPAFDIYVCSSVKEGLSYTIIEAMQTGLPIVATNVGGNPELIENGLTGFLVAPKNPQALADKVNTLINVPDLRQKFGMKARKKAQKEFTLEKMVENTKSLYLLNF